MITNKNCQQIAGSLKSHIQSPKSNILSLIGIFLNLFKAVYTRYFSHFIYFFDQSLKYLPGANFGE